MQIREALSRLWCSEHRADINDQRVAIARATERIKRAGERAEAAEADMITGIEGDALAVLAHERQRTKASRSD